MQAEKAKRKFLSLSESGSLSSIGEKRNTEVLRFLDILLGYFQGEDSWELEQIKQLSLPEMSEDGKEWFSVSVFPRG